jgi:hypothetical protein
VLVLSLRYLLSFGFSTILRKTLHKDCNNSFKKSLSDSKDFLILFKLSKQILEFLFILLLLLFAFCASTPLSINFFDLFLYGLLYY